MKITVNASGTVQRLVYEAVVSAIAAIARKFGVEITVIYNE
jgi:hypothetical protein